jgi:hypothetical protein
MGDMQSIEYELENEQLFISVTWTFLILDDLVQPSQ